MLNEISSVYTAVVYMCNADYIDDSDFDDIGACMTRLNDAWEKLRKTQKEKNTKEQ